MFSKTWIMQTLLFSSGNPAVDRSFSTIRRTELGQGAWIEHQCGWMSGHEQVFQTLLDTTSWVDEKRWMYEREVQVPRLLAHIPKHGPGHPIIDDAVRALTRRYGWTLNRVSACYYRDGSDSVAEHGDRVGELRGDCVMAIVSVGAPRRFTLRPVSGGRLRSFELGWGDLLVMGGSTQATFLHGVPKVAYADPRISLQLRPAGRPDVA